MNSARREPQGRTINLKKDRAKLIYPSKFDLAESFDPESFDPELTTEGLVAGYGSLVLR